MPDKEYKTWVEQLTLEVTKVDDKLVEGGNCQNLKRFLLQSISQQGQITKGTILNSLKAIGNNANQFAKLT